MSKNPPSAKGFPAAGLAARIGASRLARNVAVLASGTAAGQALTALAYLVLVRLYDPADFGLFAVFGAINMTLLAVATWRYELAVVLARTEAEAVNLMAVALLLALATSLLTGGLLVAGGEALLGLFGAADLAHLVWFLPIASISGCTAAVFGNFGNRGRDYALLSWSQVWRSGGVACAQVAFGLLHLGVPGLILGQIFGSVMGTLVLVRQYAGRYAEMLRMLSWPEMRRLAREHADFPRYNAPAALLNSLSVSLPSILLAFFFGPAVAGLYWFAYRLMEMPISLIGRATRRVFFAEAAERHREGKPIARLYLMASLSMAGIALPPAAAMVAFGQPLFELAFGAEWRDAGLYASWMAVWWLFRFASVPSHMLAPVLGLQKQFLVLQVAGLLPRLLVIPLAAWFGTALHAVAGYSLVGVVLNILPMLVVAASLRGERGAGTAAAVPGA